MREKSRPIQACAVHTGLSKTILSALIEFVVLSQSPLTKLPSIRKVLPQLSLYSPHIKVSILYAHSVHPVFPAIRSVALLIGFLKMSLNRVLSLRCLLSGETNSLGTYVQQPIISIIFNIAFTLVTYKMISLYDSSYQFRN